MKATGQEVPKTVFKEEIVPMDIELMRETLPANEFKLFLNELKERGVIEDETNDVTIDPSKDLLEDQVAPPSVIELQQSKKVEPSTQSKLNKILNNG